MKPLLLVATSLTLYVLPTTTTAQVVTGTIRNQANEPLPYVNIGLVQDKRGTVSDSMGRYRLDLTAAADTDSLRVSTLGYATTTRAVAAIRRGEAQFVLAETPIQLGTVTIRAKEPKVRRIGNKGHSGTNIHFGGNSLGTELCTQIKLKRPSEVQYIHLYLDDNTQPIKVRVNFYPVANGLPGPKPLTVPIYTTLPTGRQVYTVDVRNKGMNLEGDVYMGVEILSAQDVKALTNVGFQGGIYSGPTFSRKTHLSNWEQVYDWIFVFGVGFELTVLQ